MGVWGELLDMELRLRESSYLSDVFVVVAGAAELFEGVHLTFPPLYLIGRERFLGLNIWESGLTNCLTLPQTHTF